MLRIEQSKFFPEVSMGFVQQKIAPLSNLKSWMVGVSLPVLFFTKHSQTRQARLALQIAQIQASDNKRELNNRIVELRSKLQQTIEQLDYFDSAALIEAQSLQKNALLLFQESETDITSFVQSMYTARNIYRNYIETVYSYNISALEIELYTD